MNASLRRTLLLSAVLLAAWAGWYGWQSWKTSQELNRLANVVRSGELDKLLNDPPEEIKSSVDLAIRGIVLRQGKDGKKNFELRADWATLNQKSNDVTVRDPDVFYTLDAKEKTGGNRTVRARSKVGRVENNSSRISMSGEVQADSDGNSLSGKEAVYRNDIRILDFPDGAELRGDSIEGAARQLAWDLNTNTISGSNGVRVRWTPAAEDTSAPFRPSPNEQINHLETLEDLP